MIEIKFEDIVGAMKEHEDYKFWLKDCIEAVDIEVSTQSEVYEIELSLV